MSAAEMPAGAAPERTPDWHSINWKKVWRTVRRLQARIVKAVAEGRWNKVKALVYLLTHSFSGRALAILRVVSNSGAKTPGVDGVLWNTPEVQVGRFQHPAPARLPTATAPPGVHPQEQRQTARPRDSDVSFILHLFARGLGIAGDRSTTPRRFVNDQVPDRRDQWRRTGCPSSAMISGVRRDPPGAVRHRLDAVQTSRPAPGGDRGDVHVQSLRRHLDRTAPVPTIPVRTRGRALGTTAGDRIGISDPLDLGRGEGALGPGSKTLPIQQAPRSHDRCASGASARTRATTTGSVRRTS